MIYLYNSKSFNPYFNLALEDYFLDYANNNNCLFLYFWQNENTVVIGRNQDAFAECNIDTLKKYKGFLARRKTGGGAVFHDKNNLNFSFIVPKDKFSKQKSMEIIKNALNSLGINSEISGRNDILVDGNKCSGNAYLNKNNVVLHHGTILINTNVTLMQQFLTVHEEKLKSKGVKSVKSRVVNLQTIDNTINSNKLKLAVKNEFVKFYCDEYQKFEPDYDDIQRREKFFSDDNWLFGDKKFANIKSFDKKFAWGMCSLKILKTHEKSFVKIYSDSLNSELIERAEYFINNEQENEIIKNNNKIIVEIFEFYSQILSLQ